MLQIPTRTIFIGDVHGCFDELLELIEKLNIHQYDTVFFTGDLISKGPKSLKVLKLFYKNRLNFFAVQGNKEYELLQGIKEDNYYNNCEKKLGKKLIKKYPEILEHIKNLPYYIDNSRFLLVHAGIVPNRKIEEQNIEDLCYIRELKGKAWYDYYHQKKIIIYGHRAVDGLRLRENTKGLDSGCVYGGKLSAYILESDELVQVDAKKIYKNPYKKGTLKNIFKSVSFNLKKILGK